MRNLFKTSVLLLFLFSACNFPGLTEPVPDLTFVPDTEVVPVTDTPPPDQAFSECGYAWAREPLDELSNRFVEAIKGVQPQAHGFAEAYGENCINNQGEVVRFLAMETDFHVTLQVQDLEDKAALGDLVEQVLGVVSQFPVEETPGPQPGYVGITFEGPEDELRLWFTQRDAEDALENGMRGVELFNALQSK